MKTKHQNLHDATKGKVRTELMALNAQCFRKEERSKIKHLSFHLRKQEKEE